MTATSGALPLADPPAGESACPPGPRVEYAGAATLHGLVEEQVERTPEAVAVAFEGRSLTYRELDRWANRIAHRLIRDGAGPEARVGVMMERSLELVAALYAVVKAGAAFVPLDPGYPAERLAFMLADAAAGEPPLVLAQEKLLHRLPEPARAPGARVVCLDLDSGPGREAIEGESAEPPPCRVTGDNAAYVLYTSGSTGKPKGAVNTHRAIRNRLLWMQEQYRLDAADRVLQKTPYSFDVSVWEFFWPLLAGARLVVARPEGHKDSAYLVETIVGEGITTLHFVPSMLHAFLADPEVGRCTCLQRVIASGEALTADLQRRFFERLPAELHNLYGPTEAAIDVTHWPCRRDDDRPPPAPRAATVPIGWAIANTTMRVLDRDLVPVPRGGEGELYIGGVGLARGYHARPGLTADRFVPDPLADQPGERLYRTGDLARVLPEGSLEFLGRVDFQVKLRGQRIELGEIESALGGHPAVREVAVGVHGVGDYDHRLVAWAVPDDAVALPVRRRLELERRGELEATLVELPNGMEVACRNRPETEFVYREIFEQEVYLRHGVTVADGDVVVDVGANVGLFTLFATGRGPRVSVLAFEPIPQLAALARLNAELYGADARVVAAGVAARPGEAEFTYYPHVSLISGRHADPDADRSAVREFVVGALDPAVRAVLGEEEIDALLAERLASEQVHCELTTLSSALREHGVERIDLLKIDVEKSELEVLEGIEEADWPRIRQVVAEVHDLDARLERVRGLLCAHGFEVTVERDASFAGSHLFNLYAVRPGERRRRPAATSNGDGNDGDPRRRFPGLRRLIDDLRRHCQATLPEHMMPGHFVLLPAMPLTPSGKTDRRALPAPPLERERLGVGYREPRNRIERELAGLWSELLALERVGIDDDLLELGGHSLLAAQFAARLRQALGVTLAPVEVFRHPTVATLAERIERRREEAGDGEAQRAAAVPPPLVRMPREGRIPPTFPQEQIWLIHQLAPDNIAYNFQYSVRFRGPLSRETLERALTEIVRRHEVLRTTFEEVDGEVCQTIHPPWRARTKLVDLSNLPAERREAAAEAEVHRRVRRSFDLARLPLIEWTLVRLGPEDHVFVHVEHHFVHDGWALMVFLRELRALYAAFAAGRPSPLPELPVQFADFALWQRKWMSGPALERQLDHWRREIAGSPGAPDLPTDRPRPRELSFRGARLDVDLPPALYRELRAFCRGERATLFMIMTAAFEALVARYSGQDDFLLGSGVANRRLRESEPLIGMIVNTLVLRADVNGDPTFRELLERVRESTLGMQEHQDLPFERLVAEVQPERDLSRNPLFQHLFSFHDAPVPDLEFAGLTGELIERHNGSAKADLNVVVKPRAEQRIGRAASAEDEQLRMLWEYSTDLYDAATIERMWGHYRVLLEAVLEDAGRRVFELPLLTEAERTRLAEWRSGPQPAPSAEDERCVHRLVAARAERTPGADAVVAGGRRLSYRALDRLSARLAGRLAAHGVGPETVAGVCLEPGPEMVVALLAVLRAGGAYLPLDPGHPDERLAYILADAAAPVLVTREGLRGRLEGVEGTVLAIDGEGEVFDPRAFDPEVFDSNAEPAEATEQAPPPDRAEPDNLAYVIYTSGSTGRPKGTGLTHAGLANLVAWHRRVYRVEPGDRATQIASPAFDASVWELWPYLAAGAAIHFPPQELRADPRRLYHWLAEEGITLSFLPTPLAEAMLEEEPPDGLALRALLVGGDRLHRAPRPGLPFALVNHYGPTESTVVSTAGETAPRSTDASPEQAPPAPDIGRPIDGLHALVLDRRLQPVPEGVTGQLWVGGAGLARGYLGRPALTAERFGPDPLAGTPGGPPAGSRLYATGDLVRWLPDGRLDFVGRADDQVKIRGFRIEPGEIEAVLESHPAVRRAAVVAVGNERLAGFWEPAAGAGSGAGSGGGEEALRRHLEARLPPYMVPADLEALAELPLDPHGKIDRRALAGRAAERAAGGAPPRRRTSGDPREEIVAGIFAELLGHEVPPGVDEDFFALGGHSLLAARAAWRIEEAFGVEMPLATFFSGPTAAGLAGRIAEAGEEGAPEPIPATGVAEAPLSFAQQRLWLIDRMIEGATPYHIARAWDLEGPLDLDALRAALGVVVDRHAALRTTFHPLAGGAVQRVAPPGGAELPVIDLSGQSTEATAAAAQEHADEAARGRFDLAAGPPWRARLLRLGPQRHRLVLTVHHVAADGWALNRLLDELGTAYAAAARGAGEARPEAAPPGPAPPGPAQPPELPRLSIQYPDYAVWQRRRLTGERLKRLDRFWVGELAGAPQALDLPADRARPSLQTFRGGTVESEVPAAVAAEIVALARAARATPFMALLAAFGVLLGRLADRDDLLIGTPVAGRDRPETEPLVGLFVNTLALRLWPRARAGFRTLLEETRRTALAAYAHREMPFERLVERLAPERDLSRSPLFQVLFGFEDTGPETLELAGLEVAPRPLVRKEAHFELALFARRTAGGGFGLTLSFNRDLFDAATVERFGDHLGVLLAGAAAEPERPVAGLPLLTPADRHRILDEWNDTAAELADDGCLHHAFERRAAERPEAPAVVTAGEEISYRELDRRADRLAWRLRRAGVGVGTRVALRLARTPRLIEAVLAVHKAGGAYVPVEAEWPANRVKGILADHGIRHLVCDAPPPEELAEVGLGAVVRLDGPEDGAAAGAAAAADDPAGPPPSDAGADDLAYIIFTSGSTGRPKGVMVRHRPALNLIEWVNRTFSIGPDDRVLFITALSFDLSVYDVFGVLAAGGSIRLVDTEERRDPRRLVEILTAEPVTFWDSAPAALLQCVPFFPPPGTVDTALRLVFLSGDWVPLNLPPQVRHSFLDAEVVALGGATEATVWSNFHRVDRIDPDWASIPYGRPIANARYHVLDRRLEPCPIGVPGDLYIGGACLSDGYAEAPRQTAQQYIPDPFVGRAGGGRPGDRLYRTGDRARYRADGEIEFLGRLDTQVKVRGFRIELGEIEAVLSSHPGVAAAVVLVREDAPGDQRLVAYFEPASGMPPSVAELRELARRELPEYMVPGAWVERTSWPTTANGKLDRARLPAPERPGASRSAAAAPDLERLVAEAWCEVLEVEEIGLDDNFFDLGGHSLLMAGVHARLEERLGCRVRMLELFRHPTVSALAEHLRGEGIEEAPSVRPAPAPVSGPAPGAGQGPGVGREIAVVGLAGRFPGARDVDEFWANLRAGVESIRRFGDDELLAAGVPAELLDDPRYVKARGMLEGVDLFDAGLFGFTPREAELTDPQQRLFLEAAWAALEHAGYDPGGFDGRIGVFGGVAANTYGRRLFADRRLVAAVGPMAIALGNQVDYLSTRISYRLALTGPSVTVQTACSTSLVAVHMAAASLLAGECEMAIAGGATVHAREVAGYLHREGGIESPDGRVRAFDAAAAGAVNGSGVGVVVLRRLADALADRDTVHAVIRGSAVNNDGARKVGYTAPSEEGQARVIADALAAAGVTPETVGYIEAHGTGTALGDPIEVAGLARAFAAANGSRPEPWALGSVKTNLGHLDAAAGIAGLIKTVLALRHREIPPSLHFSRPHPQIDLEAGGFRVATELADWPAADGAPRRAGVSSFGIGGTNAHVVLEEAPPAEPSGEARPVQLLVLSARSEGALAEAAGRLAGHLAAAPVAGADDRALADAAWTLAAGRRAFAHRRAVVCRDREGAVAALLGEGPAAGRTAGEAPAGRPRVAFLFPGQGAQHVGMAAELYAAEPVVRDTLDEAAELLAGGGVDLRSVLYPVGEPVAELERTAWAQPALFAVEVALARLWRSWGVVPDAMLGHSLGEYSAACLAGVFSFADGLRLVAARGRLMDELPEGDMLAVAAAEDDLAPLLAAEPELAVAAVNAPRSVTVSGPAEAVARLADRLAGEGVRTRPLATSHAFHSAMMDPAVERFREVAATVELQPPEIPFVSNSTGTWIEAEQATDAAYWARHLRSTVRFADGLGVLLAEESARHVLLEVGPGHALTSLARRHPRRKAAAAMAPSLAAPGEGDLEPLLAALGKLWAAGVEPDWPAFYRGQRRRRVPLPGYPFERRRHWLDGVDLTSAARPPEPGVEAEREPEPEAERGPAAEAAPGSAADDGAPRGDLERAVAQVWSDLLGVDRVRRGDDFFDLGGSSLAGLQLAERLARELDVALPGSFLLEASTVAAIAELIAARRDGRDGETPSCLVRLQRGSGRPLFLVHQVGGHVFTFRDLARGLGRNQPVYGLRALGLEPGEEPLTAMAEMAEHYLALVRAEQPRGPYLLGGASMGGMVAFDMARRLTEAGEDVALLALMDTPCGDQMPVREGAAEAVMATLGARAGAALDRAELAAAAAAVADRGRRAGVDAAFDLAAERLAAADGIDLDEARRHARVLAANIDVLYDYRPEPWAGELLFFRAAERRPGDPPRPELPWIELARGSTEVVIAPGDHLTMHHPPHVETVAARLRRALALRVDPRRMSS